MGRTVTSDEIKGRFATDLLQEVVQGQEPLIVRLENGTSVFIQQYEPSAASLQERPNLKPLLTLPGYVPDGWKDAVYGRDGSGSAGADNDW